MAYKDFNGRITIDEVAARRDINNLEAAIQKLQASKKEMIKLSASASEMKGETALAISDKSNEIKVEIDKMISLLQSSADYIKKTVAHYKSLDAKVKAAIEAANVGNGTGGGGGKSW